jgi:squalene cyclase
MDITKSIAFIEERGSDLEIARIRHILYHQKPETDAVRRFTQLQNDDGGFPYGMVQGNLSTVNNTLVALWWMEELGILESTAADRAVGYLLVVQGSDGSWDEKTSIAQYDLPPWISPGDLRTMLYLTSYAAYLLGVKGYGMQPAFQESLAFLRKYQDDNGKFHGYFHTTWIATSAFLLAGPQYSEVAERGLQALADKPLVGWEASQIAWALDCLSKAGLQKSHPFAEKCLTELLNRCKPDGSWSSEDGEAFAVGATIGVLKVFELFGFAGLETMSPTD